MKTLLAPMSVRRNPVQATIERASAVTIAPRVVMPPPDDTSEAVAGFDRLAGGVAGGEEQGGR